MVVWERQSRAVCVVVPADVSQVSRSSSAFALEFPARPFDVLLPARAARSHLPRFYVLSKIAYGWRERCTIIVVTGFTP